MIFRLLFLTIIAVHPIQIPFIDQAILIAKSTTNMTILTNQTCQQCLCRFHSAYTALNWFSNNTCQLFYSYPRVYTVDGLSNARLYFLQGIFPNASECCMSNSYVFQQLDTAPTIRTNVSKPRCLVIDNYGYLVTVSQKTKDIIRLYPANLSIVNQTTSPVFTDTPTSISYYDEAYYIGFDIYILILHTNNFSVLANITTASLLFSRDIGLLHNGQIMIVLSTGNNYILFFNRTDNVSRQYTYLDQQLVTYPSPHGFWYVNDTYFYVTSWATNSIYSYLATNNITIWSENLFIDAGSTTSSPGGNHLTIDDCGRYWFALGANGIYIFDQQGNLLKNESRIASFIFHTLLTDDYVMYISDMVYNQIVRLDLNAICA
ncbi:unnamed protein product [Adineta ricciae]|uniref:Uncharacterized protein n=1 Tax=Adineta ricciae TaxID=249248 RepID=A0A814NL79_ADIRI|nr:unnamed protein product [Adineta ricciae]CAF1095230.1 unnamed protein product [Adineta ricciae]